MAVKPRNHVTDALSNRSGSPRALPMPDVEEELLIFLEQLYPARCYDPRMEDLESHLRYAGKVDLIATIRASFEEQTSAVVTGDDLQEDDDS